MVETTALGTAYLAGLVNATCYAFLGGTPLVLADTVGVVPALAGATAAGAGLTLPDRPRVLGPNPGDIGRRWWHDGGIHRRCGRP